jgi:DNA-binding CsgD family transcriptional regulator
MAQRLAPILTALIEQHWAGLAAAGGADDITAGVQDALALRHGIRLSQRQAEVALMILQGHSTPSIGLRLGLSAQTVKVFRRQLYAKCNISSQAELFALLVPLLNLLGKPEAA